MNSSRIPPVVANLLPAEIVEARRYTRSRRTTIVLVIVVALGLAGWFGQATYATAEAQDRLNRAQDTVTALSGQQRTFSDLIDAQTQAALIDRQLADLMAEDLPWSAFLGALQEVAPNGIAVTAVFGTLLSSADVEVGSAGEAAATETTDTTETAGGEVVEEPGAATPAEETTVGTLTITAIGTDEMTCAAYIDALEGVPGLTNAALSDATHQDGLVHFTVKLDLTGAALGGRYTTSSASATPSGGD